MPKQVIFRGESQEYDPILCPSAFRNGPPVSDFAAYEQFHASCNKSTARDYMFDRLHPKSEPLSLPFIALAQHYGVETRLLDVTLNPLVGLYFAAWHNPDQDGFLFFFIENFLDLSMHPDYRHLGTIIDSERIGDYHLHDDTCLFFKPEWPNARLAAQNGAFIFTKGFRKSIWNGGGIFRVPSETKPDILRQLQRFGVHKSSVFPKFSGT